MTSTQNLSKNPHVQAAAVELLAVNLKHGSDAGDEYGEEAGAVLERCCVTCGLPSDSDQRRTPLTRKQRGFEDSVIEAIRAQADRMQRALVRARLLAKN